MRQPSHKRLTKNDHRDPVSGRPGGSTGTSHARRCVCREGTARRARVPPIDYRDGLLPCLTNPRQTDINGYIQRRYEHPRHTGRDRSEQVVAIDRNEWSQSSECARQAMIDRTHDLPLTRQAKVLKLSRSSLYYRPRPVSPADLAIMRRIDELHLDYPFAGSRMLRDLLRGEGVEIGRCRIRTMMKRMGIEAIYRRPNTSKAAPGHRIYPYLLRGLVVDRPNQAWAMDITYIPMARGFVYLAAVVDWFSRRVLAWRVSIDMAVGFCLEAVEEALVRHGKPDIFNTDQGSQFTGAAFTGLLADNGIAISMDGRGAWRDNVFVERLWRSVKYEEVYLRAYDSVGHARASLGRYLDFYNGKRPHSSLDARTPDRAYFGGAAILARAA